MARRFHDAGFELVLWNRSRERAESVASDTGSRVMGSPAEAASVANIVLTSLADDRALRSVYVGSDGIVDGIADGAVAVDTSTVDPDTIGELGRAMDNTGAGFLDCPVSGSVSTAKPGASSSWRVGTRL